VPIQAENTLFQSYHAKSAVPDFCCINVVTGRLVNLVGGVFDPVVSSAIAVFEHVKDEFSVIPCLLPATL